MKKPTSKISYYRFMRQDYGPMLLQELHKRNEDTIVVGEPIPDGGYRWEFLIVQDLPNAIRVKMFSTETGGLAALKEPNVLAALIEMENAHTLDDAELILEKHGILDVSDHARGEEHPYYKEQMRWAPTMKMMDQVKPESQEDEQKAGVKDHALTCSDCGATIRAPEWPLGWWVDENCPEDDVTRCPNCVKSYDDAMGVTELHARVARERDDADLKMLGRGRDVTYAKAHEYWIGRDAFDRVDSGAVGIALPLGDLRRGDALRLVEVDERRKCTGRELTRLIETASHDAERQTSAVIFVVGS